MPKKTLPRIVAVAADIGPLALRLRWDNARESVVDVAGLVEAFRVYEPLRHSPDLFAQVRLGEHGADVAWSDAIAMAADMLWRLGKERSGTTISADTFRHGNEDDRRPIRRTPRRFS